MVVHRLAKKKMVGTQPLKLTAKHSLSLHLTSQLVETQSKCQMRHVTMEMLSQVMDAQIFVQLKLDGQSLRSLTQTQDIYEPLII